MELVCNNKVPCPGTMTGHEGGPRRRATPCADRSQQSFWKLPTRVLLVESSEESIVSTRISATVVIVLGGMLVVGCQPSKETTPNPQQSVSRVNNPVMADVTVDLVKAKLGADFTVQDEGPPLVLVRTLDPHEILVFVTHNSEGKVEHVSAHVAGPKDAVEKIDELYDGIVKSVAQAVGVTNLEALSAYADIGLTYTQMNFPYGFRLDQRYFDMLPNVPVDPRSTLIKYRENFVQRDLQVLPDLSSRRNAKPPIPGASMEQLGKLLAGFTVKAKIDGQVILYARDQPTHSDFVACNLNSKGQITYIEAFTGKVQGDADVSKINNQLWLELAGLEYQDCDAKKVAQFIEGPKVDYAMGTGAEVGGAAYFLPAEYDGQRRRLAIYASDRPAK
jgi:hypothetical protein